MKAFKLKDNVYWVGAVDWNVRSFHGYSTWRGSTYNAYLIIDKKVTLIDNVKEAFSDELLSRIKSVIDPSKIDYIITNHAEPDHSGSLVNVLKVAKSAEVIISHPSGEKILRGNHIEEITAPIRIMKSGETLSIGKRELTFVTTPMVHWPDNMLTYSKHDKLLFSNDAFGQHIATSGRMDYENDINVLLHEATKYYSNIVLPYGAQVSRALTAAGGLDFDTIAPSHGIIWQKNIPEVLELYKKLSSGEHDEKAVVVYDTMWGSTERMAKAVGEAFLNNGIEVMYRNLNTCHISDVMTDVNSAKYLAVGSPTLNNNILPTVSAFLCYLKGLAPKNLAYLAFTSYGWGGQSADILDTELSSMGFDKICDPIKQVFKPKAADLENITDSLSVVLKRSDDK